MIEYTNLPAETSEAAPDIPETPSDIPESAPSPGFDALGLSPELRRAIEAMGFAEPTEIQAAAIPLLRDGADVIGRSQTGTGKTMAFAIPAVERIDRAEAEPTVQVLILCPTRELAQQSCDEIRKLIRFSQGIWPADVYGGASMDRQVLRLRRCNLVVGTPGRVMDHMRRGTLSLANVKLVVLDEADEMLSMGFREDIETILQDVPASRQTVLFSATMPEPILELTQRFMHDPRLIEINRAQVTLESIRQQFMSVPTGRKPDALNLLLRSRDPVRTLIFCNTKLMVDEASAHLNRNGFACEGIHGDMNQYQRTRVMEGFKSARIPILVATDVAARGIDVQDIDLVINYDVPQNSEIYVHRIGRTGRAGKDGTAVTLCCGWRQALALRDIGRIVRSRIEEVPIPTVAEIRRIQREKDLDRVRAALDGDIPMEYQVMVGRLMAEGREVPLIASAAMQLCFRHGDDGLTDIVVERKPDDSRPQRRLMLDIGRRQGVTPNHIVSAIARRANISGAEVGRIVIHDDKTLVGVPAERAATVERAMQGALICGRPVRAKLLDERPVSDADRREHAERRERASRTGSRHNREDRRTARRPQETPELSRGKLKLSPAARARLLDTADFSRFDLGGADTGARLPRQHSDSGRDRRTGERRERRNAPGPGKPRDTRRGHSPKPGRRGGEPS